MVPDLSTAHRAKERLRPIGAGTVEAISLLMIDPIGALDDFNVEMRQNFCKSFRKLRSLISAVGEERLQKGKHPEQGGHDENAAIAILNIGRMNDGVKQEA